MKSVNRTYIKINNTKDIDLGVTIVTTIFVYNKHYYSSSTTIITILSIIRLETITT